MSRNLSSVPSQLKLRDDLHVLRKLWHMAAGLSGLAFYKTLQVDKEEMAIGLFVLAFVAFMVEIARLKSEKLNNSILGVMGPFMRECEREGMSGFPFYSLGTGLSLFFFSDKIAILSILFLIFSDPISSTFGVIYGRDKILPNKSLQGSLAGFITCYLITIVYLLGNGIHEYSLIWFAMIAAIVGVFSELLSVFIDDNLTIPLVSGLGITLINYFFLYL